jgi:pimeloyl-ACP methyl ester carboxylesterase
MEIGGHTMECRVRDIPVHYEDIGEGHPIVMLHGWPCDHRQMIHQMEPLFAQRPGWRRLYPDLPGMGRTPGADWITCQDDMLDVVLGFIDAVAPDGRIAIAGTSYGGYLARGVIYRRPAQVCGALLTVPAIEADFANRRLPPHQVLVHDPAFVQSLEPDEQMVLQVAVVQSQENLADFRAAIKPGLLIADTAFLERVEARYAFSFPVDAPPEPFPAPTAIIAGRQDSLCGYRAAWDLLDNFPRATFAVLDRAGHALPIEQQALYQLLVSEWLDRVAEYLARE